MISLSGMVWIIVALIVVALIVGLLAWLLDFIGRKVPFIAPFVWVGHVVLAVLSVLVLIGLLLSLIGGDHTPCFVREAQRTDGVSERRELTKETVMPDMSKIRDSDDMVVSEMRQLLNSTTSIGPGSSVAEARSYFLSNLRRGESSFLVTTADQAVLLAWDAYITTMPDSEVQKVIDLIKKTTEEVIGTSAVTKEVVQ